MKLLLTVLCFLIVPGVWAPKASNVDTNIVGTSMLDHKVAADSIQPVNVPGYDEAVIISRPMLNGEFISTKSDMNGVCRMFNPLWSFSPRTMQVAKFFNGDAHPARLSPDGNYWHRIINSNGIGVGSINAGHSYGSGSSTKPYVWCLICLGKKTTGIVNPEMGIKDENVVTPVTAPDNTSTNAVDTAPSQSQAAPVPR